MVGCGLMLLCMVIRETLAIVGLSKFLIKGHDYKLHSTDNVMSGIGPQGSVRMVPGNINF